MGGHGGLNILPQKRWNVYNFENREKVRKDEEAAAREEQIKAQDSRRRDSEFRLEQLRQARGLSGDGPRARPSPAADSGHINLFEGIEGFHSLAGLEAPSGGRDEKKDGLRTRAAKEDRKDSKRKREDRSVVISPEDEKYRMGYGVAGKGVKVPWYLSRPMAQESSQEKSDAGGPNRGIDSNSAKEAGRKKTIEELREERLKREKREMQRERVILHTARR